MHVIPWKLLRQGLNAGGSASGHEAGEPANSKLIRLLVEAALSSQPFDEKAYLAANPDVAEAVRRGKLASGREHYLATGYYEGRDTGYAGFDEAWYLKRYPDVMRAVQRGESASGLEHFRGPGIREWRSPNQAAEADIARWRSIIDPQKPGARTTESKAAPVSTGKASASLAVAAASMSPPRRRVATA
jgi:hypothetical protein